MTAQAGDAFFPLFVQHDAKASIRGLKRQARRKLSATDRRRASAAVCRRVRRLAAYQASRTIACYLAADGELGLDELIDRAWRSGKKVFVPVVGKHPGVPMRFARLMRETPLSSNRFGISEPAPVYREFIHPAHLDVVITPLVAFDSEGNRIGMGAGYYDRCFAFLNSRGSWRKPVLIGVGYDLQRESRIEAAATDVRLRCIATDKTVYSA